MRKWRTILLVALMAVAGMAAQAAAVEATQYGDVVPQIFKDKKIKVAIIRNLTADDGTKLIMATCTGIGKAWGWEVDTFITNNDDIRFQEIVTQAIQKDYDAIYISHGKKEYSYDVLKPGIDKGIKMVTFDTIVEGHNGEGLDGLTAIVQDDQKMAELTLNRLCEIKPGEPVKLLKLWYGPGGAPALDARNITYVEFEKAGKIKTVETIGPTNMADVMGDTANRAAAALSRYGRGQIDAMWGSWDELAKGGLQAILDAERTEIKLVTVDCSDVDLNLMREYPDIFLACVGCHQSAYAEIGMRLLAHKLAGFPTPDGYQIPVQLVDVSVLRPDSNVNNLGDVVPGWGNNQDFVAPWLDKLGK